MSGQKEYEEKLHKLVQYIEQDGYEKAEEIDVLTEEEYFIEKRAYVENRIGAVKKYYDNLEKKFQQQILLDIAKIKNQSYRNKLGARNQIIEEVLETVLERLGNLTRPENKCLYKKILLQLCIQGLVKILEPIVILEVRQVDLPIMKKIIAQTKTVFHKLTGMKISLFVDENNFLSEESKGGIVMYTKSKSVTIQNTLEIKLDLMRGNVMPYIRKALFGPNPNRKHSN